MFRALEIGDSTHDGMRNEHRDHVFARAIDRKNTQTRKFVNCLHAKREIVRKRSLLLMKQHNN